MDLRSLITNGAAASEDYVLWGFIMWYGVYNNITMVTHEAWGGWQTIDRGARRQRQHLGICRSDPSRRVCKKLAGWAKETLQSGGLFETHPLTLRVSEVGFSVTLTAPHRKGAVERWSRQCCGGRAGRCTR